MRDGERTSLAPARLLGARTHDGGGQRLRLAPLRPMTWGPGDYRRKTKPIPRAELAPASRPAERVRGEDDPTAARCPLCCGQGLVPPEVAITFEHLCAKAKEQT